MALDRAVEELRKIAQGRKDGGEPLSGEVARQGARKALREIGQSWAGGRSGGK
jgi:hypothetical protein